jgi:hypothetical protein
MANRANLPQHGPMKALRAFSQLNFPHICEAGVTGLGLRHDVSRAERYFLLILVTENDFAGKKATSYFTTAISAQPFSEADKFLGPGAGSRILEQRRWALQQQNRPGIRPMGIFLALILNTDARLTNIFPVGFDPDDFPDPIDLLDDEDWEEWLWRKMNVDVLGERMDQMHGVPGYSKMYDSLPTRIPCN